MRREHTEKSRMGIKLLLLICVSSVFAPGCGRDFCKVVEPKITTAAKVGVPGLRSLRQRPAAPKAAASEAPRITNVPRENTGVIDRDRAVAD